MSIPGAASPLLFASVAAEAAAYQIDRSLRFNSADSAYLNRTPSSAGNRKTWTWSGWVKRSGLTSGADLLFAVYQDSSNRGYIQFQASTDKILLFKRIGGTDKYEYSTNAVFRDPSAWYHIVVAFDTTQATASNRVKIYVNGVEQSLTTTTTAAQNLDTLFNAAQPHYVGRDGASQYFDGYLADVHFIDGVFGLTASDFGEYDDNNVWQPKAYSGTYGTNGFRLSFSDNSSNAALGDDSSGNNNDWTVNNIAASAPGLSTANEGFDVVTYSGNSSTQNITGLNFQPDLVWIKTRDDNSYHFLTDSVRGVNKHLASNATDAEGNVTAVTAFNSDGFSLANQANVNDSAYNYVAWCWKAGGTASSNTDGSITSSVSANTTYGFSIVSYTGNGSAGATVGHGLSVKPSMVIIKSRSIADNWLVAHEGAGTTGDTLGGFSESYTLFLESTAARSNFTNAAAALGDTSVFAIADGPEVNQNTATYIAYCWSEVSGFSKFGSYSGTGVSGNTVTTGFKPRFLIIKRTDSTGNWWIWDTERGNTKFLYADAVTGGNANDAVVGSYPINATATGFSIDNTADLNSNNATYIYAAFAGTPDGSIIDSLIDTPTNADTPTDTGAGGEVVGNYATLNPLNTLGSSPSLANGNLQITSTASYDTLSTIGVSSGKWYCELTVTAKSALGIAGIIDIQNTRPSQYSLSGQKYVTYRSTGTVEGNQSGGTGFTWAQGDTLGFALDLDSGTQTLKVYKNGSLQSTSNITASGVTWAMNYFYSEGTSDYTVNFGQRAFAYTAPSGYNAINTASLPDPTIADGSDYFEAKLYTTETTISGLSFSPDWVWLKRRSQSADHGLYDTVRGVNKLLYSNATNAEETSGGVSAFNSDGFDLGTNGLFTGGGHSFVAWCWDAGTSNATNTNGSITSTVRANPSAGFSIVSYTGNGTAGATVGHGLNDAPAMYIVKRRDAAAAWYVYHKDVTTGEVLILNAADAENASTFTNSTEPTSSVFSLGSASAFNHNSGTFVAYCFAPVDGYSSFGSYTGNGSADGPFVFTGFRPRWLMIKSVNYADNWLILDAARETFNVMNTNLRPNSSSAETVATNDAFDFVSNGFKIRGGGAVINTNNAPFIYACFASHPFKTARAR